MFAQDPPRFLRLGEFQRENLWDFDEVKKAFEGIDVDETLSLQLGGSAILTNQSFFYARPNSALGQAERRALLTQGFKLGDRISKITWDFEGKPKERYKNHPWHQTR